MPEIVTIPEHDRMGPNLERKDEEWEMNCDKCAKHNQDADKKMNGIK